MRLLCWRCACPQRWPRSSSDLSSDFITPSLACVKPMQIDRAKPNRVLQLEGLQDDAVEPKAATAKVTLNDCWLVLVASRQQSVLVTQQSTRI